MTRDEAIAVRTRHVQGGAVLALELQQAIFILSKRRDRRMTLPELHPEIKALRNAMLAFRLGLALGQIRKETA